MNNFYRPTSPEFQNFSDEELDKIWLGVQNHSKHLAMIFRELNLTPDNHKVFPDGFEKWSEHDLIEILFKYREGERILPDNRIFFDFLQIELDTDGQLWRVLPKELVQRENDLYVPISDWRDLHFADAAGMRRQIPKIDKELLRKINFYQDL